MSVAMAVEEERFPAGVHRRKDTRKLVFEMRHGKRKLYSARIESVEEGALCHDIARRYCERPCCVATRGGERGKRKGPPKLNYSKYSLSLELEDLPTDFDNPCNKETSMEVILKQARAAAKALPEHAQAKSRTKVQKHSAQDVGSQRIDYGISSDAHGLLPRGAKDHRDLAGVHRNIGVSEHIYQCYTAYASKVLEREALERTVEGIKEDMGIICLPNCVLNNFHQLKDHFRGEFSQVEQEYKSEESLCWKLQKIVEGHNLKSISESLTRDGNTMTGRRRANEIERLPVLEICPPEDEITPIKDVSTFCDPPASLLALDVKSSGEMDSTLPGAPAGVFPRNDDKWLAEVDVSSNIEITDSDPWAPFYDQYFIRTYEADFPF